VNRFAQLWRTTTVRLTAIFVILFVIFSILLRAFIAYQSSIQIQEQQQAGIDREVARLTDLGRRVPLEAMSDFVNALAERPGPGLYYLDNGLGLQIAGNRISFPDNVLNNSGIFSFTYNRGEAFIGDNAEGYAVARSLLLDDKFRLIVGRDVVERRGFTTIILQGFLLAVAGILAFSTLTGVLTAQRVLKRIDTINATSAKIMSGSLSERVPVTKRNDEFDGLALSLNAMLDRIENLMQGLKEVTDNVAHDLKTPLTRLRNKAEAALRDDGDAASKNEALETTISESDKLIRTFNALLMIARAEAGAPSGAFADVDVSAVAADVAELYEPAAEEAGMSLDTRVQPGVHLRANRELIGQALVNLIENALKYYEPAEGKTGRIGLAVRTQDGRVLIEVGDNGPGIPLEDRERVVERFVRLEKSRTEPGSGLGLSLVAAVARLHKGVLRIEDNGPGVCAIIDLPAMS
jgi:signal transduction histidine kinase